MPAFDPSKFTVKEPRLLPVILLLDVSDSMNIPSNKIDALNNAVGDMLDTLKHDSGEIDIVMAVITFGNKVTCLYTPPYKKVSEIQWADLQAGGMTPMGTALKMAKAMIEDKNTTKGRWYRPQVILVSDG